MKSLQHNMAEEADRRSWIGAAVLCHLLAGGFALHASTISLTVPQRADLSALVESDPAAAKLLRSLRRKADASTNAPGQPIATLSAAGRLDADPLRQATRASLEDMPRLNALGWAFAVTSNSNYAAAARRIILRWAAVNQPTGHPIDETKLEPLLVACDLTRSTFNEVEWKTAADWLRRIAQAELAGVPDRSATATNNWQSHRLKIAGLTGFLLEDRELIDRSVQGFKRQIADNLLPDGSSYDFHRRDALHYHCYTIEPLLALALAARLNGLDLFSYQAANGASLSKSLDFLIPYCDGTKSHREWVQTQVRFDLDRGRAGERGFTPGERFDPRQARDVFALAAALDESFQPLALRLAGATPAGSSRSRFPNWQSVLNKVRK